MPRRYFDVVVSAVGVLLTGFLLFAGAGLLWGHRFVDSQIHEQLASQQITFPEKGSAALAPANIGPYLDRYAGQPLVNGAQAKAYADHFIAVHLKSIAGGQTYAQASTAAKANPSDTKLAADVQTLFRGETLRGLLLTAYAFWQVGQLALVFAYVAFGLAAVMGLLTVLGFRHVREVAPEVQILGVPATPQAPAAPQPA